jgi:hypothetical protein
MLVLLRYQLPLLPVCLALKAGLTLRLREKAEREWRLNFRQSLLDIIDF